MKIAGLVKKMMMDWLRDLASEPKPCPSNEAIAGRFGFESVSTSARLIAELERAGQITVQRFQTSRVVTIVATGEQTLRPPNAQPHWRDRAKSKNEDQASDSSRGARGGKPELAVRSDSRSSPERGSDASRATAAPITATKPLAERTSPAAAEPSIGKPRLSAAVIRAAKVDGRDLAAFVTALIDMGLDCWRDDRITNGEPVA